MVKFRIVPYFIKWFIQQQQQHEREDLIKNEQLVNPVIPKVNVSFRQSRSIFVIYLVTQSTSTIADYEDQLDRQSKDLISTIHKAYKETIEVKYSIIEISKKLFFFLS
jgi:hypothetical protein